MKTLTTITIAIAMLMFACSNASAKISNEIKNAVASTERASSDMMRDANRKPGEILQLLGVKAGMKIIDLSSGGGYYTEILSRAVGKSGQVISHNTPYVVNQFPQFLNNPKQGWLANFKSKQWKTNVVKQIGELDSMPLPLQLDAAMMVLFYHDIVWQNVDRKMMNQHIFNALKPGGSFLIIDHSAKKGRQLQDVKTLHRIEKQAIINELTEAGFKLEIDSNLLSHPDDTRDYPFYRDSKTKRDETDRMVLKFVKPTS